MTLKELASIKGIAVGVAVAVNPLKNNKEYANLVTQEFGTITPENAFKMCELLPEPNKYNFSNTDYIIDFAQKHNLLVHGHTLIWNQQMPDWLLKQKMSEKDALQFLRSYIHQVVSRYKGRVHAWDVVNEVIMDYDGKYKTDSFWYEKLSEKYIEEAFRAAHDADPDTLLFYNDWGIEDLNEKSDFMYKMLRQLLDKGTPIHAVGFQMHIGPDFTPSISSMLENIKRISDLGLKVWITEMDVRKTDSKCNLEDFRVIQPKIYKEIIEAVINQGIVDSITFWGLDDSHSWVTYSLDVKDEPLLFDKNLKPKQAYFAVREALLPKG